jgi:hypothetical protein
MIGHILLGILFVIQIWYWFIYFPKAYYKPGMNKEINHIRFFIQNAGKD